MRSSCLRKASLPFRPIQYSSSSKLVLYSFQSSRCFLSVYRFRAVSQFWQIDHKELVSKTNPAGIVLPVRYSCQVHGVTYSFSGVFRSCRDLVLHNQEKGSGARAYSAGWQKNYHFPDRPPTRGSFCSPECSSTAGSLQACSFSFQKPRGSNGPANTGRK